MRIQILFWLGDFMPWEMTNQHFTTQKHDSLATAFSFQGFLPIPPDGTITHSGKELNFDERKHPN
jgi:hypothetical protein